MIDPIFLAEAAVNGLLLGGVLSLLALGLNLIFGVIDIVWIAYVDLVMICMYAVYFLVQVYGWPIWIGGLASVALGALLGVAVHVLIIQYSVHPFFGAAFGPLTFMICVLGGLGNMVGAFVASFIMSEVISIGGVMWSTEMGYVIAFVFFIVMIFARPGGILGRRA